MDAPTKDFAKLRAKAAMAGGWCVWRTDPADGPVEIVVSRWNMMRVFSDIDAAERFIEQVTAHP